MKIYKIPSDLRAFIFDIDSTLYTNQAYAFEQVDCQVRQFAKERGISADEARRMVAEYRKQFAAEHNGSKVSLGNTLLSFGVPIEQSVQWRRELLEPTDFLRRDEKLIDELKILQKKYQLICVTNNPVLPARKTLDALGISDFFPEIVGLDTCFKSKPALEPFETAVERLSKSSESGIKAENCIAIGDRYDMDIALPLKMGMGGILVNGVEEVYQIHKNVL
ncbi:MAG: HAD family hydrolase [Treponema sp.]|nr:HAD family hydrolase [Treponema sp.]